MPVLLVVLYASAVAIRMGLLSSPPLSPPGTLEGGSTRYCGNCGDEVTKDGDHYRCWGSDCNHYCDVVQDLMSMPPPKPPM
jgi:hypothetical protein